MALYFSPAPIAKGFNSTPSVYLPVKQREDFQGSLMQNDDPVDPAVAIYELVLQEGTSSLFYGSDREVPSRTFLGQFFDYIIRDLMEEICEIREFLCSKKKFTVHTMDILRKKESLTEYPAYIGMSQRLSQRYKPISYNDCVAEVQMMERYIACLGKKLTNSTDTTITPNTAAYLLFDNKKAERAITFIKISSNKGIHRSLIDVIINRTCETNNQYKTFPDIKRLRPLQPSEWMILGIICCLMATILFSLVHSHPYRYEE